MTPSKPTSGRQPRSATSARNRSTPPPPTSVRSGSRPPVDPNEIRLEKGTGSAGRGSGPGGDFWHIYAGTTRAGAVYINVIDEPPLGIHASIQIQINQNCQGRGIGRIAYNLASAASQHNTIYAHMRKSNLASRKAAEYAGYVVADNVSVPQLIMVWKRPGKHT
jgi:RimJ/RimL family protein N-acetyltransferase